MPGLHHLRTLGAAVVALVAAVVLLRVTSAPPAPGRFLSWSPAATPSPAAGAASSMIPVPTAPATPTPDVGTFGSLQVPLGSLLQGLNSETAADAAGQYSILQQLEDALRDHIDGFLTWVSARR